MKNIYIILGFLLLISCQALPLQEKGVEMIARKAMEPLIKEGEICEAISLETYARNDVVGILQKEVETDTIIMIPCRIVGLPGESIKMEDGKIFINGQRYIDPPEANFTYVLRSESIDSSFFEYHKISRYGFAIGDFWQANLNHAQLSIVENEPQVEQVIFTLRHIIGEDWVVGKTEENNWGKINWGPIKIPNVGDKVVLDEQNKAIFAPLFFEERKKNLVETECYFLINDDRSSSFDSRTIGLVPKWGLLGKIKL